MEHRIASLTLTQIPDAIESSAQQAPDPPHGSPTPTQNIRRKRSLARRIASEGGAVYFVSVALYVAVGALLDFKYQSFSGDAFSRMANGFYVLYSRDPHLAAIGFVWEPLTSVGDMVFLLGNHLWPALAHNDMAGTLTSASAMAGAGYQILSSLREWGLSRTPRLVLTALFVLNPMILFYGGNGMSEGLYLFTLVAATRYLLRWIHAGDLRSLAYAAIALAFSYLTRNEALAAVAAGAIGVAWVSFRRTQGGRSARRATALADAAIFAVPGFLAAAGWAIASYVITGSLFGQLSSIYGNSAQEKSLSHLKLSGRETYLFHALITLWPLLPVVLVVAVIVAIRRRDMRIVAPLGVLGGALGFDVLALLHNDIEPFYRYFIVTIPIEILLIGSIAASLPIATGAHTRNNGSAPWWPTKGRVLRTAGGVLLVLVLAGPSIVTTAGAMFNPKIGSEESQQLGFIFESHPSASDRQFEKRYPTILKLSSYFTSLKLPNGDIIVDNSTGCVPEMITTSSQPKLFVIPNDRDFKRELSDPLTFHAHYILEPNPAQIPVTAPNITYSTLWKTGDGFAKSILQIPAQGTCPEFRLFKVIRHPN